MRVNWPRRAASRALYTGFTLSIVSGAHTNTRVHSDTHTHTHTFRVYALELYTHSVARRDARRREPFVNAFTVCAELEVTLVSVAHVMRSLAAVMYEYTRRMCYAYLKTGQQMPAVRQSVARRQLLLSQAPTLHRLYTDDRSSLGTCTRLEPNSACLPTRMHVADQLDAEYPYLSREQCFMCNTCSSSSSSLRISGLLD